MEGLPGEDHGVKRVVVIGPECTGKTTLARDLAVHFAAAWSPEYARAHAEAKAAPLTAEDVEPIARGQMAAEDEAAARRGGLTVHDTDLVSTVVYADFYYGACPHWIVAASEARAADLYLLTAPDTPWESDRVRDRSGVRGALYVRFREALERLDASVVEIAGPWEERRRRALAAVGALLE